MNKDQRVKYSHIMVEGPDNVGKSSQIKNIIEHYTENKYILSHFSNIKSLASPEECIDYSTELYSNMFRLCEGDIPFIFDRSHTGESVYSNIYRGYDGDYVFNIEDKFDTSKTVLFIFIDTAENLISRDDGLSFSIDLDKKKYEIQRFTEAFEKSRMEHKYLINIDGKDEEEVKHIIRLILEKDINE